MGSGVALYRASGVDFEPSWFPVFRALADGGEMTVGECAARLGLTHPAVSQTARKLAARGLITTSRDASDERRKLLAVSEAGRALLPPLRTLWGDIEAAMSDAVDYGGVDILAALEGLESAMAASSLSERVAQRIAARELEGVEIVPLGEDDALAPHFKRLNYEWLEKYFSVEPVDDVVLSDPGRIVEAGGAVLFARHGEEVVGTVALMHEADGCELTKMAVTETWQGRRVGAKLLTAAIECARTMNIDALHLITNSTLLPAINLYRKFGFRVVQSVTNNKYARGDLKMELAL